MMKILNIEKNSFQYEGKTYTRAKVFYGKDPLIGHISVTENTQIYRYIQGYACMIGRGFQELKVGMTITPIFFVDKYSNCVLQSIIIEEDA